MNIVKRNAIVFFTALFILGGSCILALMSNIFTQPDALLTINIISTFFFIIFLLLLVRVNTHFFTFNIFLIINYIWFVGSLILLEGGSYTPELQLTGVYTGATSRFICVCIIFLQSAIVGHNIYTHIPRDLSVKQMHILVCAYFFLQMTVVFIYLIYGTALSHSVDRIEYRDNIAPSGYFQLITMLTFLGYPLGRVRVLNGFNKKFLDILFASSLFLLVLGGEKFSFLLLSICLYFIAHKERITLKVSSAFKNAIILVVFIFFIVALAGIQYSGLAGKVNGKGVSDFIFDRIAQQAQLNYYFDDYVFVKNNLEYGAVEFIRNELLITPEHPQGIKFLMSLASPAKVYSAYAKTNVTFGDGFPGILYLYFSWWSFPLAALLGLFYGVASKLCFKSLYEGRPVECMLFIYLIYNTSLSVFLNGEFYLISGFSWVKIISINLLLVLIVIRYAFRIRT